MARKKPPIDTYEALAEGLDVHLRRRIGEFITLASWQDASIEVWQMVESPFASRPDMAFGPTTRQFRVLRKKLAAIHPRLLYNTRLTMQLKQHLGIAPNESDPVESLTWRVMKILVPVSCPGPPRTGEPRTAEEMRLVVENLRQTYLIGVYEHFVPLYELIDRDPVAAAPIVDELKLLGY